MLGRANRFHGHNSLSFTYKNGKTIRGDLFGLRYALNPRRSAYRAAVVVSKKTEKSAVVRNRIRRKLFAAIRAESGQLPVADMIFTVFNSNIVDRNEQEIRSEIRRMLIKLPASEAIDSKQHGTIEEKER